MHWFLLAILIPYIYILLKIYRSLMGIKPFPSGDNPATFISVIIPCRNEENNLPLLLGDIAAQDYSPELFEVIVVDDNSSDRTCDTASGFRGIKNLKVYKNNGNGKKAAIRTGTAMASGILIVTVDADTGMKPGWLKTIASFYEKNKPEMIICPVILDAGGGGFFNRFQELEFLSLQGITAGSAEAGDPLMCNGANLAFTKIAFEKHASCLHEELVSGDDVFLLHSMKSEAGSTILWLESEDATVTTAASGSPGKFLKQRVRWISKAGSYSDLSTKVTAVATLASVILQPATLIAAFTDSSYFLLYGAVFLIKSVPDYLILRNTAVRYDKKSLLKWFIPSQFVYPFYIIAVISAFFYQTITNQQPATSNQ